MWRAPEELLQQHRSLHAPQVPAGGWRAAVAAAAAAGPELAGDQRAPAIAALPAMQGAHTRKLGQPFSGLAQYADPTLNTSTRNLYLLYLRVWRFRTSIASRMCMMYQLSV